MSENFTELDKTIAKAIDKRFKWIARDEDGTLTVYTTKPYKTSYADTRFWDVDGYTGGESENLPFTDNFRSISWSDAEPVKISSIYSESVLDREERRYLENIIRPFIARHPTVVKRSFLDLKEYIFKEYIKIMIDGLDINEHRVFITLPNYKADTMYRGMKRELEYTPEELGLFND